MKNVINITISLDKHVEKQRLIVAITKIFNIREVNIFFLYYESNQLSVNNTNVFVDYITLTNSELSANVNISIIEPKNYNPKVFDIEFVTALSKLLNTNIYMSAPLLFDYSIVRIEPTGKFYGANECETEDEFEYLDDITLLDKQAIKDLKKAIKKDIIEERIITEQTRLGNY